MHAGFQCLQILQLQRHKREVMRAAFFERRSAADVRAERINDVRQLLSIS